MLSGECLLLVEGQERRLRAWDFVHCPAWTEHVFVGAGDGPCAILAIGGRSGGDVIYPASELAQRHGAGVAQETPEPRVAYAGSGPRPTCHTARAGCLTRPSRRDLRRCGGGRRVQGRAPRPGRGGGGLRRAALQAGAHPARDPGVRRRRLGGRRGRDGHRRAHRGRRRAGGDVRRPGRAGALHRRRPGVRGRRGDMRLRAPVGAAVRTGGRRRHGRPGGGSDARARPTPRRGGSTGRRRRPTTAGATTSAPPRSCARRTPSTRTRSACSTTSPAARR